MKRVNGRSSQAGTSLTVRGRYVHLARECARQGSLNCTFLTSISHLHHSTAARIKRISLEGTRSQLISIITADAPTEAPPSNAGATPHLSADVDVAVPSTQYTYDDRQSHGYVYTQESDLNTQPSSHHESTPPMTPDDTMSLSGSSARDRSVSQSPGSLFRDLPKRVSKPALSREREPRADHAQGSRAGIQSADFPILLVPSRTPSPAAIPPHPQTETESDREHTTSRTRTESLSKRNSAHNRLRKTSATKGSRGSLRQRKLSNASLRRVARKTSTASESSLSVPQVRVTNGVESTTTAGAESNPGVGSKFTKFLMPKKSLSHVSLGLTPLPNVSLGSPMMQSANTSMGSAITVSATPVFPKDSELSQLQSRLPVRESIVVDPETVPHSRRLTQPVMDLDTPVDTDTIADLIAELRPQVHIEEVEGDDDDDVETYTAMTTLTRPLSPVRSRSPDDRTNAARISHFSVMQRTPSPPQHSRALPVPPPRAPSAVPDPSLLPAPRSESPAQFYRSSTPRNTEVPMPAPLPISPPHHDASECPTPLPLPPSPRAASPAPPLLQSRLEDPLPSRPKTPPQEPRSRRREGSKEEDRQSAYLPVAQLRPQSQALTQLEAHPEHPQSHNQLQMVGRTRTANSSNAPARRSTVAPLVQVQPPRLQSPPGQAPPRRQSPAAEQQYRAQSPSVHLPFRPQIIHTANSPHLCNPRSGHTHHPSHSRLCE
ncbi:hypothetical protein B0H21DRAFT_441642 [Amylocystis lapponica]|nr:hypothetical protein B0H21DRAFT_441642 [Amylocystis lapponica]